MKRNRKGLFGVLAALLALLLILGAVLSLAGAGTRIPENPIDPEPSRLMPESMARSGGSGTGDRDDTEPPTEPETEPETEPTQPQEETEPPETRTQDPVPDATASVTEPTAPDATGSQPDPSTPGTDPTSPTVPNPGPTEPRDPETEPHIVTNLQTRAWTPKELENDTLFTALADGSLVVSNDTANKPVTTNVTVDWQ